MPKSILTVESVRRMKPPKTGRLEVGDAACPGLLLRVTDRGVRSFSVIFKVPGEGGVSANGWLLKGRQHRITLGTTPPLELKDAREQAREILRAASEGHDPRDERREQNLIRHTNTFDAVFHRFLDLGVKPSVRSWKNTERVLRNHVVPVWGSIPIRDIRRRDAHELLDDLVAANHIGTAREVRKHLHRLFNWAVDREIVPDNPLHGMERKDLRPNEEAGRKLSDEELRAIWSASGELGYPFGLLYRLLILTGQRRNEWANARRSEIDADRRLLEVPKTRYKGGRDHVVPLADLAWEIVASLPEWVGNDYHLFSTRVGHVPVSGFSKAKARLDEGALKVLQEDDPGATLGSYRVHDFRVTCESRLADLGFVQEVRDAVLGHAKAGLQKTYNKHDYLDEKRAALNAYAEHVLGVVS